MYIADHIARAERIEATNRRLDPAADYEMVLWNCMHIATHHLNAALHAAKVTEERGDYAGHEPYYYYVRGGANNGWKVLRAPLGDVIHSYMPAPPLPSAAGDRRSYLEQLLDDVKLIESFMPRFVRGETPYSLDDGTLCLQACQRVRDRSLKLAADATGGGV